MYIFYVELFEICEIGFGGEAPGDSLNLSFRELSVNIAEFKVGNTAVGIYICSLFKLDSPKLKLLNELNRYSR